jgi:hypothetical protein
MICEDADVENQMAITAAIVSPDGTLHYKNIHVHNTGIVVPANLWSHGNKKSPIKGF